MPKNAAQHVTAGPYSPVLEIDSTNLVVISGQAALDIEGKLIGDNVEDQSIATIKNCKISYPRQGVRWMMFSK